MFRDDPEHPWDQYLREHVLLEHRGTLESACANVHGPVGVSELFWAVYIQGIAIRDRQTVPLVGNSLDRRAMDHLAQAYNDERTRALICFCCAQ